MEKLQLTFNNTYTTKHKIGKGKNSVYLGTNRTGETQIAIKLQKDGGNLEHEAKIYKILKDIIGIPKLYWFGKQQNCSALVIDVLGPSLADLLKYCEGKFTLKTVLMITNQVLERLQAIHNKGLVYRDVKPTNFLIGMGPRTDKIYIIDFQLTEKYVDIDQNHLILGPAQSRGYSDSLFLSIHGHLKVKQSRRDDLQSLGYMIVYFLNGSLPWSQLTNQDQQVKNLMIKQAKLSCPIEVLCKGLPVQIAKYFNYVRKLQYEQEPDYVWIKRLFQDLFVDSNYNYNLVFDWAQKFHQKK